MTLQNTFENNLLARHEGLPSQSDVLARFRELILADPEEIETASDEEAVEAAADEEAVEAAAEQEADTGEEGSEDGSQTPDDETYEEQVAPDSTEDELAESEATEEDS